MTTPVEYARRAVDAVFAALASARTSNEREAIAREIARLTTVGQCTLTELADAALQGAHEAA